jgi:hypothetical protein
MWVPSWNRSTGDERFTVAARMIIRRHHNSNFTIVPNAIYEDGLLSIEARGLLGYLLSRPHDWQVRLEHVQGVLNVGRDRLQRMIRELIDARYVECDDKQPRDDEQKFASYNYIVRDVPSVSFVPQPEKPLTASRGRETRNGVLSTKTTKTEETRERGRFIWPSPADGTVAITPAQLGYLLEGIDWRNPVHTWRPRAAG